MRAFYRNLKKKRILLFETSNNVKNLLCKRAALYTLYNNITTNAPFASLYYLNEAIYLGSVLRLPGGLKIPLETRMSECVYSVFVLSCV
jgi:hypothetical protein